MKSAKQKAEFTRDCFLYGREVAEDLEEIRMFPNWEKQLTERIANLEEDLRRIDSNAGE